MSSDDTNISENENSQDITENLGYFDQKKMKKAQQKQVSEELWGNTGFQRVLGGFWHNYIFNLFVMIFGIVFLGVIFPQYILPFPEAIGFKTVVSSLFALLFTVFDIGIGSSVTRFVAEHVGRGDIKKALEYLRFFIWFQMFTGILQISIISYWALEIAKNSTSFAPLIWFFLINSTVQYPGMLGIYRSALQAFQRHDKSNIVGFVQSVFLEMTTQIVFILLGRMWGANNPYMGELMGATMGYIIGLYIDDFIAMILAGYFFKNILKPYNISLWETFIPQFDKDVAKESMIFGLKNMFQGIFYQISMLLMTAMTMWWLPNYASILGLFYIADGITRVIIQDLPAKAAISESFNCGKIDLTDYYIRATFKWYGILTFYLAIEVVMLIPPIIGSIAANYSAAAWMIPYIMLSRFFIGPIHFSDSVQQGADKPELAAYSLMVQMIARAIFFYILLNPKMIPSLIPGYNYALGYILADVPAVLAKNIYAWWVIDRKIVKVRINYWQTLITPAIAILPLIPINLVAINLFNTYAKGDQTISLIFAMVFLIFILFGAPILVVFPMIGLFGGWDEKGLEHFNNASIISGPSRFLVTLMYKTAKFGHDKSPFTNLSKKFRIPWEKADKEAAELVEMRNNAMACLDK